MYEYKNASAVSVGECDCLLSELIVISYIAAVLPLIVMYVIWIWGTASDKILIPSEIRAKESTAEYENDVLTPMLHSSRSGGK